MTLSEMFWWPFDLDKCVERDFAEFRDTVLSADVLLQHDSLEKATVSLARAMGPHIDEIVGRDGLPHLAHAIVGWGDAIWKGRRLTDRIASFATDNVSGGRIPQCDPEGDFHPWQSFAYAAMAGAQGDRPLAESQISLRTLVYNSRRLNTSEGRELGHLLFALANFDPDPDGAPFYLEGQRVAVRELPEIAIHAHHFGTFEVCRKFHLTEGLCAASARIPRFDRFRGEATGFLVGQMTILELFTFLMSVARDVRNGIRQRSLLDSLRDILRVGPNLENHLFYSGHLLELAGFAKMDGYDLTKTQESAVHLLINETNQTLMDWLPCISFPDCFLSLGHYRRAVSLWAALEKAKHEGRPLLRNELQEYTVDFDQKPWVGPVPAQKPVPGGAVYEVVRNTRNTRPNFAALLEAYARTEPPKELAARGQYDHFRRIGPDHWPRSLHYELLDHGTGIGVEVHLEKDEVSALKSVLQHLTDQVRPHFPDATVIWDDRWYKGRGRLVVYFTDDIAAERVAAGARDLVNYTYKQLDGAVSELTPPE